MLVERCPAGHGYGSVSSVLKDKLPNLNGNFTDAKLVQEMRGEIVGKCFKKLRRLLRDKDFCFLAKRRIIDRSRNRVLNIAEVTGRPKGNIKNKSLAPTSFRL